MVWESRDVTVRRPRLHLSQISERQKADWSKRIERAGELSDRYAWAAEVLRFYRRILQFQKSIYDSIPPGTASAQELPPLREALNFEAAAENLSALVLLIRQHGPTEMADRVGEISVLSRSEVEQALRRCAMNQSLSDTEDLMGSVLLQPYAEKLALWSGAKNTESGRGLCPACDGKPLVGVLRPEGDGGKRWLVCSFCLLEWDFRRILCPYCGEQDHRKLPVFSASEHRAVMVSACHTCRRYLKLVDMTVDGHAVPIVDEMATAPLDVWAVEQGYQKLQPNLLGF